MRLRIVVDNNQACDVSTDSGQVVLAAPAGVQMPPEKARKVAKALLDAAHQIDGKLIGMRLMKLIEDPAA